MPLDDPSGVVTRRGQSSIEQLLRCALARIEALGLDVIAVVGHSGEAADAGPPDGRQIACRRRYRQPAAGRAAALRSS